MKGSILAGCIAASLLLAGGWWLMRAWRAREAVAVAPAASLANQNAARMHAGAEPSWDETSLMELCGTDPRKAVSLAEKFLHGAALARVLAFGLERLTDRDPAAAAEIVARQPAGAFQQVAAGRVARALAKVRPVAALAWARSLADEAVRLRAMRETFAGWGETDPATAAEKIPALESERERALGALALVTSWVRSDPAAALHWAQRLPPAATRALLLSSAVQTWAERDAAAVLVWLAAQPPDIAGEINPSARPEILGQLAKQDAVAAKAYVVALPAEQQPEYLAAVVPVLARADPAGTMQWALSLKDTQLGDTAFSAAFRHWRDVAPVEAQHFIDTAGCTAEEKARLFGCP
jgi:hypothetical protein